MLPTTSPPNRERCRGDSGSASTEVVIAMPALLLLVLASVHVGLWYHARHIASAASEEGARAARYAGSTDTDGETKANQFIDQLGPNVMLGRQITVTRTATSVTVTVAGHSPAVIPGLTMDLSASTTSPLETFRPN